MSRKQYIDKEKDRAGCANIQPSLFDNSVVEHTVTYRPIVSHSTRRRKRKRRKRDTMESIDSRKIKGQILADSTYINHRFGRWFVKSSNPSKPPYEIREDNFNCNCPDFVINKQKCKHLYALETRLGREVYPEPNFAKSKHTQNWSAYHRSQQTEKAVFLGLLAELTRGIDEPENETGRPALHLGDMVFSCVFKVYSQMSSRRFQTDLIDAKVKGYINESPHYNSLIRYMEKDSLTAYLELLVGETSKPLASLETDFAVDSTGLGTKNAQTWYRAKYKDTVAMTKRDWVKLHCCVGVKTNIITAVEVTGSDSHDAMHFIPVMEATRKNFTVKEVSADKGYSSAKHLAYAESHGMEPFIAFKENAVATSHMSTSLWKRMFHYYSLHRDEFARHYSKRNNVETTFHMLKSKFGSQLKSKTKTALKNEVLCKVICHNISVLWHSMNEFGITPNFLLK
jgi:transposase